MSPEPREGVKAFSSVRAISYSKRFPDGGYNAHVRGEAVIMDLPGGPVFALLYGAGGSGEYAEEIAEAALVSELKPGGANRDYRHGQFAEVYPTKPNIVNYMPKDPLPMFVRFRDISDPTSIERVDPASIGVLRVTVEKASEDVTTGIKKCLGWLGDPDRKRFDENNKPAGIPIGNFTGLFSTEPAQ